MKKTLLLSALALTAGLATAQTQVELPKMQNEAVKANFANIKLESKAAKLNANAKLSKKANIKTTAENGILRYAKPTNVFNCGFSHDWYSLQSNVGLHPAYQELTWKNISTGADNYSWEYSDPASPDGTGTLFAETTDLNAPAYPFTVIQAPILSGTIAGQPKTYQYKYNLLIAGGNNDQQDRLWGACTYDVVGATSTQDNMGAVYAFGFGQATDQEWTGLLKEDTKVLGIGTIYQKPEVPYCLSYVYVNAVETSLSSTSALKVAVYEVDEEGYIASEPLATGTCTKADYVFSQQGMVTALFPLENREGELTVAADLTIDSDIYVELSIENQSATDQFNPMIVMATDEDGFEEPAGSLVRVSTGGQEGFFDATKLTFTSGQAMRGYAMSLGVTNTWMFTESGKYESSVPAEGGSCTFQVNSFFALEEYATADGEGIYDWWEPTYGTFDPQTGLQDLTFTLQPLPAEMNGRTCVAKVAIPGVKEKIFTITQGEAGGVESVETSANSAAFVDGNIVVSATDANEVKVYNVAGQMVASANVEGTAVIPAANLAKGLYIVRFNDNTAVKIMK